MTGKSRWAFSLVSMAIVLAGAVLWAAWTVHVESESPKPGTSAREESDAPVERVVVDMQGLQFRPSRLDVVAGTVVTFVNRDQVTHNVVQTTPSQLGRDEALFASPRIETGGSWDFQFNEPGRFPILCLEGGHYAVGMLGTINVHPLDEAPEPAR